MPAEIDYKRYIGCGKCHDLCPVKRAIDITYPASFR